MLPGAESDAGGHEPEVCHGTAEPPGALPSRAMTHSPEPRPRPVSFHADRSAGTLEIAWEDGHRSVFDLTALRWLCPCAYCRGEAGLPGWLDSSPTLSEVQTSLSDLALVGTYAIAPTWGDGHASGFYPFELLRGRCPCDACAARRDAEA